MNGSKRALSIAAGAILIVLALFVAAVIDQRAAPRDEESGTRRPAVLPAVAPIPIPNRLPVANGPVDAGTAQVAVDRTRFIVQLRVTSEDGTLGGESFHAQFYWRQNPKGVVTPPAEGSDSVECDVRDGSGEAAFARDSWQPGNLYQLTVTDSRRQIVFNGSVVLDHDIHVMLHRPVLLAGVVTIDGRPGDGLLVSIEGRTQPVEPWRSMGSTHSMADGRFELRCRSFARMRQYHVTLGRADRPPFVRLIVDAHELESGAWTADLNLTRVRVEVQDDARRPIPSATVWLLGEGNESSAVTAADGTVEQELAFDADHLVVHAAGHLVWDQPLDGRTNVTVVLGACRNRILHGRVTGFDGELLRVFVSAGPEVDHRIRARPGTGVYSEKETGNFELAVPSDTPIWIRAHSQRYGSWGPVTVTEHDRWVDIQFEQRAAVSVVLEDVPAGMIQESGPAWIYYCKRDSRRTGQEMAFHFPAHIDPIPAGDYNFFVVWQQAGIPVFAQASCSILADTVNTVFIPAGVGETIRGRVVDASGTPLEGRLLTLEHPNWWGDPRQAWGTTTTDSAGQFELLCGFLRTATIRVSGGGDSIPVICSSSRDNTIVVGR